MDGKGRVIISPQYGPLLRVTPPGEPGGRASVERLHDEVGRAHGLLVVGSDLYVNVADDPKRTGGLWRLRDADGDDRENDGNRGGGGDGSGDEADRHGDGQYFDLRRRCSYASLRRLTKLQTGGARFATPTLPLFQPFAENSRPSPRERARRAHTTRRTTA